MDRVLIAEISWVLRGPCKSPKEDLPEGPPDHSVAQLSRTILVPSTEEVERDVGPQRHQGNPCRLMAGRPRGLPKP